jgi:hypothetical protein
MLVVELKCEDDFVLLEVDARNCDNTTHTVRALDWTRGCLDRSRLRALWFRQCSARLGNALEKAAIYRLLHLRYLFACPSLDLLWANIALALARLIKYPLFHDPLLLFLPLSPPHLPRNPLRTAAVSVCRVRCAPNGIFCVAALHFEEDFR